MTWIKGGPKASPEAEPSIGLGGHHCQLPNHPIGASVTTDRVQKGSVWRCDGCGQVWKARNRGFTFTMWVHDKPLKQRLREIL